MYKPFLEYLYLPLLQIEQIEVLNILSLYLKRHHPANYLGKYLLISETQQFSESILNSPLSVCQINTFDH